MQRLEADLRGRKERLEVGTKLHQKCLHHQSPNLKEFNWWNSIMESVCMQGALEGGP